MALHIRKLKKQYVSPDGAAVPVIDVDDFAMGSAEQVALIGGSGTGKTTLLHLIAGILAPDSGEILFRFDDDAVQGDVHQAAPAPAVQTAVSTATGLEAFPAP